MNPSAAGGSDLERFLSTLDIARRTGVHLVRSDAGLFPRPVDADWVRSLEADEVLAERLDAFASRFCRMQDTVGDKLLPRFLTLLAEPLGSAIDNLNRAERLGVLSSVQEWRDARALRNSLVHEYEPDPEAFAAALNRAHLWVPLLVATYNTANRYARERFLSPNVTWPAELPLT